MRGEVLTGAHTAEDRLQTSDGREVAFSMTGCPLCDAAGEIIGAVGIACDVTERRRLKREVAERAYGAANRLLVGKAKRVRFKGKAQLDSVEGKKRWHVSRRQRKVQARRREVYRKLAATRKRSHGQLAHRVLALGSTFQLEQVSYRAWQNRFGRSVNRGAPGMFVSLLSRLAASAGGEVVELNTRRAKLSQRCHCGEVVKKPLHQRWHDCACGVSTQRDL